MINLKTIKAYIKDFFAEKSTIEKLLKYKLNREQRRLLTKNKIINGCGGDGGFKFNRLIDIAAEIKELKNFDIIYFTKLMQDFNKLCDEHDLDYSLYTSKWRFYWANFTLAYKAFRLVNWTNIFGRLFIFIFIYAITTKFGKKYYNKAVKYSSLEEILNKFTTNNIVYGK